jgi:hypothetical protein
MGPVRAADCFVDLIGHFSCVKTFNTRIIERRPVGRAKFRSRTPTKSKIDDGNGQFSMFFFFTSGKFTHTSAAKRESGTINFLHRSYR